MIPTIENNGWQQDNEKDRRVEREDRFCNFASHIRRIERNQMKETPCDHADDNDHGGLWQELRNLRAFMEAFLREKNTVRR